MSANPPSPYNGDRYDGPNTGIVSSNPNEQLGFEINPQEAYWTFTPEFYPKDFTNMKKRELTRYGTPCGAESVSIKAVKNREFHVAGLMLHQDLSIFHSLQEYNGKVDLISPVVPNGGMECMVKKTELGNKKGFDPQTSQWMFEYNMDLVSTGRDEGGSEEQSIITPLTEPATPQNPNEDFGDGDYNEEGYGL
jgi:hypothetical protein